MCLKDDKATKHGLAQLLKNIETMSSQTQKQQQPPGQQPQQKLQLWFTPTNTNYRYSWWLEPPTYLRYSFSHANQFTNDQRVFYPIKNYQLNV